MKTSASDEHLVGGSRLVAWIRQFGVLLFRRRQSGSAGVERAVLVAPDDAPCPGSQQDLRHGGSRRPAAGGHDPDVFEPLSDDAEGVDQRRQDDDRRSVLVVVEDGDVELLAQALLDLEASGRRDVLEVDAPEAGRDRQHRRHDRVHVLRRQAEREGIHAAEVLEEHGLALHHGQGGLGTDVAEPEDGRAVGDHGNHVLLAGQRPGLLRIVGDRLRDASYSGRVDHRQVLAGLQRCLGNHLDLAALVQLKCPVRDGRARRCPRPRASPRRPLQDASRLPRAR